MSWFIIILAYFAAHFGLYVLVLRHQPRFIEERVIFAYHAGSAVLLTVLELVLWLVGAIDLATLVGLLSLHGIYSMSFLELWSLSQGGYSLQILDLIDRSGAAGAPVALETLCSIGASKRAGRLGGIERLGLIRRDGDRVSLTSAGRTVASILAAFAWAANLKARG